MESAKHMVTGPAGEGGRARAANVPGPTPCRRRESEATTGGRSATPVPAFRLHVVNSFNIRPTSLDVATMVLPQNHILQ
jgi:hypothetical protein